MIGRFRSPAAVVYGVRMFDDTTLQVFRWFGLVGVPAAGGLVLLDAPALAFLVFWGGLAVFVICSLVLGKRQAARRQQG